MVHNSPIGVVPLPEERRSPPQTRACKGAHGCVPGLGNVDPAAYVALYDAAQRGDWTEARAIQERLIRLFSIALQGTPRTSAGASGVGGFKTAMKLMGLIPNHHMNRPNLPLNEEETARVRAVLQAEGLPVHA